MGKTVIETIPPDGLHIVEPGDYELGASLVFRPRAEGAAFYIEADGVVLDLRGHTVDIDFGPEAASLPVDGIRVTGARRVTVRNGVVRGASSRGVAVQRSCDVTVEDLRVQHMRATNRTSKTATPTGISIASSVRFRLRRCVVDDLRVLSASLAGVMVATSGLGCIEDCEVHDLDNRDGGAMGYALMGCAGVAVRRCVARRFATHYEGVTPTAGHTCIGFMPFLSVGLRFDDCTAEHMTGCCDDAHGMSVFVAALTDVKRFRAAHVRDGEGPKRTGAKATGVEVYGLGIAIRESRVEHITAKVPQDRQSAGFSAWGAGLLFDRCSAAHVAVVDAEGTPSTKDGYGVGFGWAPDPRPLLRSIPALFTAYRRCEAQSCQVGFDTWNHIASAWCSARTEDTETPVLRSPCGATRALSMDRCSESPSGRPAQVQVHNRSCANLIDVS